MFITFSLLFSFYCLFGKMDLHARKKTECQRRSFPGDNVFILTACILRRCLFFEN